MFFYPEKILFMLKKESNVDLISTEHRIVET